MHLKHRGSILVLLMIGAMLWACGGNPTITDTSLATDTPPPAQAPTSPPPGPTNTPPAADTPVPGPTVIAATPVPTAAAPTSPPAPAPTDPPTPTPTPVPADTPEPTQAPDFDGVFVITVAPPEGENYFGKTVEFHIGNLTAAEVSLWQEGGITETALTATGTLGKLPSASGLLASPPNQGGPPSIPHVFVGTATVNGFGAPEGAIVSAWVDGVLVPAAEAAVVPALEVSTGDSGVAAALAPVGDNLISVWKFQPATQSWIFYDPRPALAAYNTITELMPDQIYLFTVVANKTAALNGRSVSLYAGINHVPW